MQIAAAGYKEGALLLQLEELALCYVNEILLILILARFYHGFSKWGWKVGGVYPYFILFQILRASEECRTKLQKQLS